MNRDRRKRIRDVMEQLRNASSELEAIKEDEQEAFDNSPESIQEGDRGMAMQTNVEEIESVCDELDTRIGELEEIVER